jgi:Arc/MetJ-type ribon-helix-helix transcriptional regulator
MSQPVTTRLNENMVKAIDDAVTSGLAPTRGAVISKAIEEWLSRHSEDAIRESYKKRYESTSKDERDLVTKVGLASTAMTIPRSNR